MKKKGQLLSEPFVWIFALIVGGLILIWGVKTVMDLKSTADTVDLGQFKTKIQTTISAMKNYGEGSSEDIAVQLGGTVKYVCFSNVEDKALACKVKSKDGTLIGCPGGIGKLDPALGMRIKNSEKENMWIVPFGSSKKDAFTILYAKPVAGANPICYANGRSITVESKTTYVELK